MKLRIVGFAILLVSCQEEKIDSILQKKYEEQEVLIQSSRNELESLQKRIAEIEMPDPTSDLKDLKTKLVAASTQKSELELKIRELESEAVAAQKKLEDYTLKYPLKIQ
ncbi:MAG: septal ring factor EnvC (AmiA/AmiB activator) [Akkermansiaceae bacterium]|jgi:septal ring factor EnvC (AmiA/AmiB activator)